MRTHTSKPNYSYSTNRAQERKKKESRQIAYRHDNEPAEQEEFAESAVGEWGSITSKVMRTIESGEYQPDPAWVQHMAQQAKARGRIANYVRTQLEKNSISSTPQTAGIQLRATNPITPVCRKNPALELKATPPISLANGGVVQAKLTIGEPNDKYEQEADRVAAEVVQQINRPAPVSQAQGESVQGKKSEEEELRMKSKLQGDPQKIGGGEASRDLETAIDRARGGGRPLDEGLQESMGQAMGADFSGVRVHTDARADQLNQSIQARAFTTGQDMYFRQGGYQPRSQEGQELIAHELTHVVQQDFDRNDSRVQRKVKLTEKEVGQEPEEHGEEPGIRYGVTVKAVVKHDQADPSIIKITRQVNAMYWYALLPTPGGEVTVQYTDQSRTEVNKLSQRKYQPGAVPNKWLGTWQNDGPGEHNIDRTKPNEITVMDTPGFGISYGFLSYGLMRASFKLTAYDPSDKEMDTWNYKIPEVVKPGSEEWLKGIFEAPLQQEGTARSEQPSDEERSPKAAIAPPPKTEQGAKTKKEHEG